MWHRKSPGQPSVISLHIDESIQTQTLQLLLIYLHGSPPFHAVGWSVQGFGSQSLHSHFGNRNILYTLSHAYTSPYIYIHKYTSNQIYIQYSIYIDINIHFSISINRTFICYPNKDQAPSSKAAWNWESLLVALLGISLWITSAVISWFTGISPPNALTQRWALKTGLRHWIKSFLKDCYNDM